MFIKGGEVPNLPKRTRDRLLTFNCADHLRAEKFSNACRRYGPAAFFRLFRRFNGRGVHKNLDAKNKTLVVSTQEGPRLRFRGVLRSHGK